MYISSSFKLYLRLTIHRVTEIYTPLLVLENLYLCVFMSYTCGVLYLSPSVNTSLDQRVSEPLMYTQFVEIVVSGKAYSLTAVASRKGQGRI